MVCWGLWLAAMMPRTTPAVTFAIASNIFSGLVANLVLVQFVQFGPFWLALLLELVPPFALYR